MDTMDPADIVSDITPAEVNAMVSGPSRRAAFRILADDWCLLTFNQG